MENKNVAASLMTDNSSADISQYMIVDGFKIKINFKPCHNNARHAEILNFIQTTLVSEYHKNNE